MNNFEWKSLIDPVFYINLELGGVQIGLWVVLFIIFAETGLFAGFFLPGDSLLFLAGIYSNELVEQFIIIDGDFVNVLILVILVAVAGILGNFAGYWFGAKSGVYLYNKQDTFWFKKKYLFQSKDFFEKYGGKAIIFARFLPVFRTFAPIIAGIVAMDQKKFTFYNIVSSFVWSFTLIMSGHYLQKLFEKELGIDLKSHIEIIIIIIVLFTTVPVLFKLLKKSPPKEDTSL
ncbi:DedA family protein [Flavobacterium kingsejongi]|uniref:Alkaline phosphatase n=1 Tax=Flavobacterium kingsejongi TaxID=1678728 RepID=A0A2S1LJ87_9FLAO|nr:VTT domain-containing protein [Flavobacterium kingsejongi]AWG23834.1 alkaline phosphatase [Flavobacterium kingsejongi]